MALRYMRERKGVTYYREKRTTVPTKLDNLTITSRKVAEEQLIPLGVEMQKKSLVDKIPIDYFQVMGFGRPCSCLNFRYKVPDRAKCTICYGIGFVGGFNKIGSRLEIIDTTRAGITLNNVVVDDAQIPNQFKLDDSATSGDVLVTVNIPTNIGVDTVYLYNEGDVTASVKQTSQPSYTALTQSVLESMQVNQLQLDFKIHLSRASLQDASPTFTHLYLRWKINIPGIIIDMPHKTVSVMMQEFGLPDLLQSVSAYIPATIDKVTTQDFFIVKLTPNLDIDMFRDEGKRKYKITEVTANKALGVVTSWDITCRLIQAFEMYAQIPV